MLKKFYISKMFYKNHLIIRNVSSAPNQYVRMIFERSSDTEDWSDAEYLALSSWIRF